MKQKNEKRLSLRGALLVVNAEPYKPKVFFAGDLSRQQPCLHQQDY